MEVRMDVVQDIIARTQNSLYTTYVQLSPYLPEQLTSLSTLTSLSSLLTTTQSIAQPVFLPLLSHAYTFISYATSTYPAYITAIGFALAFLVVIQILSIMRRIVMFWTRLAFKLMWWGALVAIGSWVLQRGVGRTVADVWSFLEGEKQHFGSEYERYAAEQQRFQRANAGTGWR